MTTNSEVNESFSTYYIFLLQWFSPVATTSERQVIEDTLKDLPTLPLPNTHSTIKLSHSMSFNTNLLTRSSNNGTYSVIKQKIIEHIKANNFKP